MLEIQGVFLIRHCQPEVLNEIQYSYQYGWTIEPHNNTALESFPLHMMVCRVWCLENH